MHVRIVAIFTSLAVVMAGCSGSSTTDQNTSDGGAPNSASASGSGAGSIDGTNTKISFVGTKPDGKHDGGFSEFSGNIDVDEPAKSVTKISVTIQTASLWSDDPKLTNHLKSPDFFNVNNHPTATFESSKIEAQDAVVGQHTVTGNLTLLGVTKEISFPATANLEDGKLTLSSEFKVDRNDFGMTYGEGKVDPEVTIRVEINAAGGSEA